MIFQFSLLLVFFEFWVGEEVFILVVEDVDLYVLWLKIVGNFRGVVVYWYGNWGFNWWCLWQVENLVGLGYDVFMFDYWGFGKSEGSICFE